VHSTLEAFEVGLDTNDPAITPAESLAEAQVSFGDVTNLIFGVNKNWQVQGFSLKATSNSVPLQITGLEPGVLLDSFNVSQRPPGNLYYLPEQPLQALVNITYANSQALSAYMAAWCAEFTTSTTFMVLQSLRLDRGIGSQVHP